MTKTCILQVSLSLAKCKSSVYDQFMKKLIQTNQQKITLDKQRSPCPVASTLDLIGDKWTLLIVRDLFLGCQHYKDFLNRPEKIATNILANRLNKLVAAGIVHKAPSDEVRGRDAYSLTEIGYGLEGLLKIIKDWGLENIEKTEVRLY